jgi:hypothetical protein
LIVGTQSAFVKEYRPPIFYFPSEEVDFPFRALRFVSPLSGFSVILVRRRANAFSKSRLSGSNVEHHEFGRSLLNSCGKERSFWV